MAVTTVTADVLLPALTVAGGLAAAIFTALRFNRDDATAIVAQQHQVLDSMKSLNDELGEALDRQRAETITLRERNLTLEREVAHMRGMDEGRAEG